MTEVLKWIMLFVIAVIVVIFLVEVCEHLAYKRRRKREDAEMRQEMRRRV